METEKQYNSSEKQEFNHEQKEKSEEGLVEAAAMERADLLIKEVKNSKKQMQNIAMHIQQVTQALRQLRQQLQLVQNTDDPISIKRDKEKIEELKKRIKNYGVELEKMKDDLIKEQLDELSHDNINNLNNQELYKKAKQLVESMIEQVKE